MSVSGVNVSGVGVSVGVRECGVGGMLDECVASVDGVVLWYVVC